MALIVRILCGLYLCAGIRCVHHLSWLPCQFVDEGMHLNNLSQLEAQHVHRDAVLQFGKAGDAPVNPNAITFLVTGSKLDLRRFLEQAEAEQVQCELRRYSTQGIHVRWPTQAPHEHNVWFSCELKHSKGLFAVTGFLRHPSDTPPSGQHDFLSSTPIRDGQILTTTVAMVIKTLTPSLKAGLMSQPRLHCQFAADHRGPNVTVEWHRQHRGERTRLFSYNGPSGRSEGSGVALRGLAGGEASYALPLAKMTSEGMYICSVAVTPLFAGLNMNLHIEEPPRVSVNIGSVLVLQENEEQKVVCQAEGYFPLDVDIAWYKQDPAAGQRVGAPLPEELRDVLRSSHRHNHDMTYSLSAFFLLKASHRDSGKQFTCRVSHQSLRVPVRKSFVLSVEEPSSWSFNLVIGVAMVTMLAVLCLTLPYLHKPGNKRL